MALLPKPMDSMVVGGFFSIAYICDQGGMDGVTD